MAAQTQRDVRMRPESHSRATVNVNSPQNCPSGLKFSSRWVPGQKWRACSSNARPMVHNAGATSGTNQRYVACSDDADCIGGQAEWNHEAREPNRPRIGAAGPLKIEVKPGNPHGRGPCCELMGEETPESVTGNESGMASDHREGGPVERDDLNCGCEPRCRIVCPDRRVSCVEGARTEMS